MKKFVIFALIAVMAAGVAFAQTADGISINAWGRAAFSPLINRGANQTGGETDSGAEAINYAGQGVSWFSPNGLRTDFRVNGNSEFIGFQVQIEPDEAGGGHVAPENSYIWAKPFGSDILKLTVGRFQVDTLRGKIATDTGFENFVVGDIGEDTIFHRFESAGKGGFLISSQPIEPLFIGIRVNGFLGNGDYSIEKIGNDGLAKDNYRKIQIGFGYEIADIGHFRAQYIGGWMGTLDLDELGKQQAKGQIAAAPTVPSVFSGGDPARIEAAFALTAVDNLLVDIGLKFWMPITYKDQGTIDSDLKVSKGIDLGLGATYRMDAFAIAASVKANFGAYYQGDTGESATKKSEGMTLDINVIPTYDLDAFTIGASIGLRTKGASTTDGEKAKDNTSQFGFGAFVEKGLGSGSIKAGLAYRAAKTTDGKANGSNYFSIPVVMTYAFF